MKSAAQPKTIEFRLIAKTTQTTKDKGEVEVTWGSCSLPPTYLTRDVNGVAKQETIKVADTLHKKSGIMMPVPINQIDFINGSLFLTEGKDDHIIKGLRNSVNNADFKHRFPSDKAIYYEFDRVADRLQGVSVNELIAEAFSLISVSSVDEVVEYAKAIGGIPTEEVDSYLKTTGSKKKDSQVIKATPEYIQLTKELKAVASKDPQGFVDRFNDASRTYLAAINEGVAKNVMGFNMANKEFYWVVGSSQHVFAKVPRGTNQHNNWLANWFQDAGNEATYNELLQKLKAAS